MMDTSDEWKSLWPISSVHSPPLLLSPTTVTKEIGPLIFNPSSKPQDHNLLFTSLSISPQISPPFPKLSLPRFLYTASSILPSTTTSIASQLASYTSKPDRHLAHNTLQLLRCPGTNSTLAFFPTGSNSDEVGFVVLSVENSRLNARGDSDESEVFTSRNPLSHRIVKILVSPLADCECISGDSIIGYLLVCTMCSVHYYNIRTTVEHSGRITPGLELVGSKKFKGSSVVHACWSPHVPEQSLVLLESGDLFLFDLNSCSRPSISSPQLIGKKLKTVWDVSLISEKGNWLSCEFSWHPRIMIVVHSSIVFLVDSRSVISSIIPLLKLGVNHDRFLVFSIAGPDLYHFTVASNHMVFVCDVRKPMIPVLRWTHNIAQPSFIMVSSLSDLRSMSDDVTYSWASETGFGILLGSFWNSEFSLFCYGPHVRESVSSSFYAWGLPSDLSLVTGDCRCGSCLVKEEFGKDQLPNWINWQQKKEFVLGFGILDSDISSQLFDPDIFGGFTLVTLTSSGNLESHRYCASWDYSKTSGKGHIEQALGSEDSVLYETGEEGYKFKKKFQYLKLDWLEGYLNSDLARILSKELVKNYDNEISENASFKKDFHENICQQLDKFGSGVSNGSINIHDVFKDISLPTSVHEIALRSVWANLPRKILRFCFSNYSHLPTKLMHVPFEFLEVPCDQPHLPPFLLRFPSSRSNKWSDKHKPSNALVGPVIPIPVLMTFHKTRMLKADSVAADSEIDLECGEVIKVANEVTLLESKSCDDHVVSLADDDKQDEFRDEQSFASYKPAAFSCKLSMEDSVKEDSVFEDEKHTNLIYKVGQKDVKEIFDSDCPLKFKFDEPQKSFGPKELKAFKLLKRQFSNFKDGFSTYQDYMAKSNTRKP
ncbi:uncharacterized protein [Rutidosis leptorrhynchoides]|uniref:uncharacterized protein n=1 Tax=Rutidosis leptorrhynchoides TaxID=125765 RepID=UPI003A99EAE0